ncbi:LPS export ABC transporter periplasmic protein LptC [Limnohabitans sp. T6-5]|uniref:LPS export ABC transporter periplasmic protein LptC n=1 Tax=Limnohabitans sp. T6-5 TaxID=1100724 RepID=UPI000D38BB5C|nr:LPS export ABC transporter periplasmic protein LptC [Limnohabitans sp. T6-5]PUE06328.1 LPS export ABC transporter periplasmic protein LptC [Limnohabitans sp. T6-5]
MNRHGISRVVIDKLTLSLPLMALGLLALGSWWLVQSMPDRLRPAAVQPVRQDPDYRLENFSFKSFDATGRMTHELRGEQGRHFPATDELDIQNVRIVSLSDTGSRIDAQALQGIATGDGKQVTLLGKAQAIRPAFGTSTRIELHGDRLLALVKEHRLLSSDPVKIIRDQDVFTAQTMNFNSDSGEYILQGRVRGVLAPQP